MGLFGTYVFKSKVKNKNFWLHMRIKGKSRIYYFSKDPKGAIGSLPGGYTVYEDPKSGLPFLKKKGGKGKKKEGEEASKK